MLYVAPESHISHFGKIEPTIALVYEASAVNLECFSESPVLWTINGHPIESEHIIFHNNLFIQQVLSEDSGIYRCTGTHARNKTFNAQSEVIVGGMKTNQLVKYS